MIFYYQNSKTRDLIIYDSDENELLILERIENVRVFLARGDIQAGDFGKDREQISRIEGRGKKLRITPDQIEEMKALKKDGKTIGEIAEAVGVSP